MLITADYLKNSFGINAASFGKRSNQTIAYTGQHLYRLLSAPSVGLYNAKSSTSGNRAATANTQVFIATQFTNGTITVNLETCGSHRTGSLEQMGVGFGREVTCSSGPAPGRVDNNPLMNLTSAAASVGVWLGRHQYTCAARPDLGTATKCGSGEPAADSDHAAH